VVFGVFDLNKPIPLKIELSFDLFIKFLLNETETVFFYSG